MLNSLSIIIPVYNEEAYIGQIIEKVSTVNFKEIFDWVELIVIDDGSTDNSYQVIQDLSIAYPDLKYLKLNTNSGKGSAIRAGFEIAKGSFLIVQDSDLELVPEEIVKLAIFLKNEKLDMVNGSRFLEKRRHKGNTNMRNFANSLFSNIASIINLKTITDLTCGYKLFTRKLYENIKLRENRFGIEAELLTKALKYNQKKVKEYPVSYYPREIKGGKKIRFTDGFRIIWACIKYKIVN